MRKLTVLTLCILAGPAAAFHVPVDELASWKALTFNNIAPNSVSVDGGSLYIAVRSSASPLVYKLDAPIKILGVSVAASWGGRLNIPVGVTQGDKDADDFVLKFGIVEAGDQTLNWLQRRIAASWIRELYSLAPRGAGVQRINFLSTTQQPELLGTRRTHPLNEVLHEERITLLETPGAFEMTQRFSAPIEVLGLWISSDGDDTDSSFDLTISSITLHVAPLPED